jgi:hypothetical protein
LEMDCHTPILRPCSALYPGFEQAQQIPPWTRHQRLAIEFHLNLAAQIIATRFRPIDLQDQVSRRLAGRIFKHGTNGIFEEIQTGPHLLQVLIHECSMVRSRFQKKCAIVCSL